MSDTDVMGTRTVHSFCRICSASCGLLIELDDQQVVRVAGDPDHPVSRGYTCSKGRSLGEMHHAPYRLEEPLLRGEPSTWDEVMVDLGERLATILREHGPDSIACYRSTGWVFDTNGRSVVDRWIRTIGSHQIYSPATIDTPNRMLVPDMVFGAPFLQPVVDWANTRMYIALGQNTVVSHGHATAVPDPVRRIREIKERGGSVIVADPRLTETGRLADVHLPIRPGTDAALAAFFVNERFRTGCDTDYLHACADPRSVERLRDAVAPYDRDATARICDVDPGDLERVTSLLEAVDRVSFVSGTGVSMGPAANAVEWLGWALCAVTGSLDRKGGMLFNPGVIRPQADSGPVTMDRVTGPPPGSRPEFDHAYGEYPSAVLCDEILSGKVRAVLSFGGSIVGSFPDTAKTVQALQSLDVLAVAELRHTQTTELATHVLPTSDQLERPDVTFFLDNVFPVPFAQYAAPAVRPVGSRRPLWRTMADLARKMGIDMPAVTQFDDDDELLRSVIKRSRVSLDALKAAPSGVVVEDLPLWDWMIPQHVPKGALDLAPDPLVDELRTWAATTNHGLDHDDDDEDTEAGQLSLICRRLPHQINSDLQEIPSQQRAPHATLLMSEPDARRRDIADGETVTVANRNGSTQAVVEITDRIRPGVVSLPHSWRNPVVNRLTSTEDLDPLTGMPRYTAIGVFVSRGPSS